MRSLWLPDGSPRWCPGDTSTQIKALKAVESTRDQTSRFVAVCEWEKVAIQNLEFSLVMARDLAASEIEPCQQSSVKDFLTQIDAVEAWWRVSISQQAKGLLSVF